MAQYEQRVLEVEHSSFILVIFSTTGDQGKAAAALYSRIAGKLSKKCREPFSVTMAYVRTRLFFRLIRSAIASLRGHRCRQSQHASASAIFAAAECYPVLSLFSSPPHVLSSLCVTVVYVLCRFLFLYF